jgi:nucleotide-binding universal stress UspA family protein
VYTRILVGTDGSPTAASAVDRAVEVAAATGAELTILCVGDGERARTVVDTEASRHATSGVHVTTRTASGDPASTLIDVAADEGYDLLVVGNKGMTGASRFFLGSVPNKVSHHAPVSLLIVRTT